MVNEHVTELNKEAKNIVIAGWLLAISVLLGTGLIAVVNWHSTPYITENERQMLLRNLNSVIPPQIYDNEILSDNIEVVDQKLLGSKEPTIVYRARMNGKPVAVAMKVIAPKGYSGPIVLLIGVDYSGQITGVRVVKHRETPGLGDGIEIQRSDWIENFFGKSIYVPTESGWKVKRDGGKFDQLTGATITPRAIVGAVYKALKYYEKNRVFLFSHVEKIADNKGHP